MKWDRITKEEKDNIIRLYDNNHSISEIERMTTRNWTSISRVLKKRNIPKRPKLINDTILADNIINKYNNEYLNIREISDLLKISTTTVQSILEKNKIEIRPNSLANKLRTSKPKPKRTKTYKDTLIELWKYIKERVSEKEFMELQERLK